MHAPEGASLAAWIRDLDACGRLYMFYKSPEWRALRAQVMADHHGECEACAARGLYRHADTVHHEFEVREFPAMALTRWALMPDGTAREVLHPLCNRCHNDAHGRTCRGNAPKHASATRGEMW